MKFPNKAARQDYLTEQAIQEGIVISWYELEDKPPVIAAGDTPEQARQAIGASNLEIGTTATTAKAGNYQPTWAQVSGKPTTFPPSPHDHTIANVTGLSEALASKSDKDHTHSIDDITNLRAELNDILSRLSALEAPAPEV